MKTVRDLLREKGNEVWSVSPEASVFEALETMAQREIGALVVMDGEVLVGIFSERDYARQVILKGKASRETRVDQVMTSNVLGVQLESNVEECMQIMTEKRVRHLPVLVGGKLSGLVSIGDVVKAVIADKQSHIEELESYIAQG